MSSLTNPTDIIKVDMYMQTFNLEKDPAKADEYLAKANKCIEQVMKYPGNHEGENDSLQKKRLKMSPEDALEYATTMKRRRSKYFKDYTGYGIIFRIYQDANVSGELDESVDTFGIQAGEPIIPEEPNPVESVKSPETNNNEEKEIKDMSEANKYENELKNVVTNLEKTGSEGAKGSNLPDEKVGSVSGALLGEELVKTISTRVAFTQQSAILAVVYAAPKREELLPQPIEQTTGIIAKPQDVYESFLEATGCTIVDGVGTYTKLAPADRDMTAATEAAEGVRLELLKAIQNPTMRFKVYDSKKPSRTVKGWHVQLQDEADSSYKEPEALATILIQKSAGTIPFKGDAEIQVIGNETKPRARGSSVGDLTAKSKTMSVKSITTLRIANKAKLESIAAMQDVAKSVTSKVEASSRGWRADLPGIRVNTGKTRESTGNPIYRTWRPPLQVECYVTKCTNEKMKKELKISDGDIGNTVAAIDISDANVLKENVEKQITKLVTAALEYDITITGVTDVLLEKARQQEQASNANLGDDDLQ